MQVVSEALNNQKIKDDQRLDSALNFVFSFFDQHFALRSHLPDAQVRKPGVLAALIADLGIAPNRATTTLITGSKGKGSTARMIAWSLQSTSQKVGLVVSPEELHHLDRIRIDNVPIGGTVFADIVDELRPRLLALASANPAPYYHSPSDLFLLVALVWFARQRVDFCVLEGGRGVKFDLIGSIPAFVGCVTSVLPEHLYWIGPTIHDVANDKLSLRQHCTVVIAPNTLRHYVISMPTSIPTSQPVAIACEMIWIDGALSAQIMNQTQPNWLIHNALLAQAVLNRLLGPGALREQASRLEQIIQWGSPSYAQLQYPGTHALIVLDGAIDPSCFDLAQLQRLSASRCAVVIGLSTDKARQAVIDLLRSYPFALIAQVSIRIATANPLGTPSLGDDAIYLGEIDLSKKSAAACHDVFKAQVLTLTEQYETIYFVGVQLFLRSIRTMLNLPLLGPSQNDESRI